MKPLILVGLGNPGKKYQQTRHNVGFLLLDYIKARFNDKGYNSTILNKKEYSLEKFLDQQLYLFKPLGFMNNSGQILHNYLRTTTLDLSNVIVAHDDLDIGLGKYKLSENKSPKIHNGLISIEQAFGTKVYRKYRIGIDARESTNEPGKNYVLAKFKEQETDQLKQVFAQIYQEISQNFLYINN